MPTRWERRNALAQARGYRNYYDYRIHDYGVELPAAPRPAGERLARLRGHRSLADLESLAASGRVELIITLPGDRDPVTKQWKSTVVSLTLDDGTEKEFTLRGKQIDKASIKNLQKIFIATGVPISDPYGIIIKPQEEQELEEAA